MKTRLHIRLLVALAILFASSTACGDGRSSPQGGTITSVQPTSGGGLEGGGTAGHVSLGLITTCSPTNVLAWSGSAWACGDGVGTAISGTQDTLAKFGASGHTVGNSSITDDGTGNVALTFAGGPYLYLKDTSTTADPKVTGNIVWQAKDAAGAIQDQASLMVTQNDKTNSSNDSTATLKILQGGTLIPAMTTSSSSSGGFEFRIGNGGCVASASVSCGELWANVDDFDLGGTITAGKIDGSGTSTIYGAGSLGIANGSIPAADWVFGKNLTISGHAYANAQLDVVGQGYFYVTPTMAQGLYVAGGGGGIIQSLAATYIDADFNVRTSGGVGKFTIASASGNAVDEGTLSVKGGVTLGDASSDAHTINGTLNANSTAGSNGDVLTIVSGLPEWQADSGDISGVTVNSPLSGGGTSGAVTVGMANGDRGDITTTTGSQTGDTWIIDPQAVTYAKIQNVSATSRILGRVTAGAGSIEELTGLQVRDLLPLFDTSSKGLTPVSPGGTTSYLRADGTWATPPGTPVAGTGISVAGTTISANLAGGTCSSGNVATALSATGTLTCTAIGTQGGTTGSGTTNTIPKWTSSTGLGNSHITDDGSLVTITSTSTFVNSSVTKFGSGSSYNWQTPDEMGFGFDDNAAHTGYLNWSGYLGGTSQFRTLIVGNGKNAPIATFTGSTKQVDLAGALTVAGDTTLGDAVTDTVTISGPTTISAGNLAVSAGGITSAGGIDATVGYVTAYDGATMMTSNGLVYGYNTNSAITGKINGTGYLDGTTQFRNLEIDDGKGAAAVTVTGSTKAVGLAGALTVTGTTTANGDVTLGDANADALTINATTTLGSGVVVKLANSAAALATKDSAAVTLSSCGTSPTVHGDRTFGHVTLGAGATGCTLTWGTAFSSSTPSCMVTSRSSSAKAFGVTVAAGSLALTSATAAVTYDWFCGDHY